jgi:hypothetical protein
MISRKPIGNAKRFEVFKRDLFTCQYCGAKPPNVVLEVDHILPVSKGGSNSISNLSTSCFNCNRGKRDKLLTTITDSQNDIMAESIEKQKQFLQYNKFLKKVDVELTSLTWDVANIINGEGEDILKTKFSSIKNFIKRLGYSEVKEAAEIASSKFNRPCKGSFLYFCGICHNKIKQL